MIKSPAFQFYPNEFLADVADMTQHEVGAFILLLSHQWNHGSIPADVERQKNLAKGEVPAHVLAKFKPYQNGLRNPGLENARRKQAHYREKQRQNGIASGQARRERSLNGGSTSVPATIPAKTNPLSSLSSSSSLQSFADKGTDQALHTRPGPKKKLTPPQKELADRMEQALGDQWVNDAGKWVNRIKDEFQKAERVIGEVENALKEGRIKTTPGAYAHYIWEEFK
ncbi:MAG TPA: hypothetical protein VH251_06900 [Verrucomicrobiae bacterium]|jgi:uncharacterized protein YdaU (DUF1376 family)|nr:hypothetical protein [Verrucomicrobiae bacterium]